MAWRSSGETNSALIENLSRNGLIKSPRVKQAMLAVDRAHYAPLAPYQDSPQSLGHRATISAPHMHASAAESLLPYLRPGARVLDVGSGSGYLTHVLAELVKSDPSASTSAEEGSCGEGGGGGGGGGGKVIGIEHIPELVAMGERNTKKSEEGRRMLESGGIEYVLGDGRKGWEAGAPYDAIHVGAAAQGHQEGLVGQLKSPGRMFIPVKEEEGEGGEQWIWVVDKDEKGEVRMKREFGVRYVPLTDAPGR